MLFFFFLLTCSGTRTLASLCLICQIGLSGTARGETATRRRQETRDSKLKMYLLKYLPGSFSGPSLFQLVFLFFIISAAATTTAVEAPERPYPYEASPWGSSPLATTGGTQEAKRNEEETEVCTQNLRDAVNAAIAEVIGSRELTDYLLPLWNESGSYVPLLVCGPAVSSYEASSVSLRSSVSSSLLSSGSSSWPSRDSLLPDDLLYQILQRGTVRVAGIARNSGGAVKLPNRGAAGDYTLRHPTGFFPDYMRSLWGVIGRRYGVSVSVSYVFFASIETAQIAVAAGLADMTDIYFLLSHQNKEVGGLGGLLPGGTSPVNPLSFLYMSCPVIGAALRIYTKEGVARTFESLIETLAERAATDETTKDMNSTVVVFTEELKETIEPILPSWTDIQVATSVAEALKAVARGKAVAAFLLGPASTAVSPPSGVSLNTGIDVILAKGAWIRRSRTAKCLRREHIKDLAR